MNLSRLAIKSLLNRAFAVSLTVITMALSVALIVSIEHIREEVRAGFGASVTGTDLVIGPRGSPLELILNAVFHIGNPNHALSWSAYQNLTVDSDVAWAIPIALGDSHRGFPVIATDNHYFRYLRYGRGRPISFQEGRAFSTASEVVLGSEVVSRYGYSMGDELELSHGVGKAAHHLHGDEHFVVVGILEPTGTPIDHTVHIPLEGMSQLHAGWIGGRPIPGIRVSAAEDHPEAINSVLIGLHQRTRVFEVQRRINNNAGESLTAVIPALVLEQLWRLVEPIQRVLEGVALLVFGASILGMASMMLTSLDARRRELSILRAVGAAPRHLFFLLLLESALTTLISILVGLLLAWGVLMLGSPWLGAHLGLTLGVVDARGGYWWFLFFLFTAGVAAGALPAWRAQRLSLSDGLAMRL